MQLDSRGLLWALLGFAATIGLQWLPGLVGPAGSLLLMLTPLPAIVVGLRAGWLYTALVAVACAAVLLQQGGSQAAIAYLLQFGFGSVLLVWMLENKQAWDRALLLTVAGVMLAGAVAITWQAQTMDASWGTLVDDYLAQELEKAREAYNQTQLNEDQKEELAGFLQQAATFVRQAFVAIGAVLLGLSFLVSMGLAYLFNRQRDPDCIRGSEFKTWKVPEVWVWFLIGGGFATFFAAGWLQTVGINLVTVLLPVYFLNGLAIVTYYFQSKGYPPVTQGLGYVLLVLLNPLPLLVTGLGVFDLWFDFRKPRKPKDTE